MGFYVGQKVCCIKGAGWEYHSQKTGPFDRPVPDKYEIVTITGIHPGVRFDKPYLSLAECPAEIQYAADCFRPLQETGMSILKAILANPHKQLETVE